MMGTRFYLQCRKCRTKVAEDYHVLQAGDQKDEDETTTVCDSNTVWYINDDNMPEWISIAVGQEAWQKGKLYCPKCKGRLGSFNFIKMLSCPDCHHHSLPAVHVLKDRVDQKLDIKLQRSSNQDTGAQSKIYDEVSSGSVDYNAENSGSLDCKKLSMACSNFPKEIVTDTSQNIQGQQEQAEQLHLPTYDNLECINNVNRESSNRLSINIMNNSKYISEDLIKNPRLQAEQKAHNFENPGEITQKKLKHLGEVDWTMHKLQCQMKTTEEKSGNTTNLMETVDENFESSSKLLSEKSLRVSPIHDQGICQENLTSEIDLNLNQESNPESEYVFTMTKYFDKAVDVTGSSMIPIKGHRVTKLETHSNKQNLQNLSDKSTNNINAELLWTTSEIDFKFKEEKSNCSVDSVVKFNELLKPETADRSTLESACIQFFAESENIEGNDLETNTSLLVKSRPHSFKSLPVLDMLNLEVDRDLNNMDLDNGGNLDVDSHLPHFNSSGMTIDNRGQTESHDLNFELIENMSEDVFQNDCEYRDEISEEFSKIQNFAVKTSIQDELRMEQNQFENEIHTDVETGNPEIFMQTAHSEITKSEFEKSPDNVHLSNNTDVTSFSDQEHYLTGTESLMVQQPTTTSILNGSVHENSLDWDNDFAGTYHRETNNTDLESFETETTAGDRITDRNEFQNNVDSTADVDVDRTLTFDFLERNERRGRKRRNRRIRQERNCKRRQKKEEIEKDKEVIYEPWLIDFPDEHICPVCFDLFCEPHGCYPCDHVLCEGCLRRLGQNNVNNTPCPMCRQHIVDCIKKKDLVSTLKELYPDEYRARLKEQRRYLHNKFSPLPHRRMALEQTQEDIRNRILGQRYQSNLPQPRVKLVLTGFLLLVCFVPAVSLGKAVMDSAYGLVHDFMTWL